MEQCGARKRVTSNYKISLPSERTNIQSSKILESYSAKIQRVSVGLNVAFYQIDIGRIVRGRLRSFETSPWKESVPFVTIGQTISSWLDSFSRTWRNCELHFIHFRNARPSALGHNIFSSWSWSVRRRRHMIERWTITREKRIQSQTSKFIQETSRQLPISRTSINESLC